MNTAVNINGIVDCLWPQPNSQPDPQAIERNLQTFNNALSNLSINELYQILELSSHKALLMVLQKCHIIINKFIDNKKELLIQISNFFMGWLHPTFQYDLKRSYDHQFIQSNIQRSISRFIGKILEQITISNLPVDWQFITNYLQNLGQKNNYFQVLVISGYFDEIEIIESEDEDHKMIKNYLKSFEYEIISKVIKLAIKNVSFCKQTLELLEIEHLQSELRISNQVEKTPSFQSQIQYDMLNSGKIKYLKLNFELIKKVINFNYDLLSQQNTKYDKPSYCHIANDKCSSFPDYIIKPILEDFFLTELYQIASILLIFKLTGSQSRISFAEIILELINKIIKTKILDYQIQLKEKFLRQILQGQSQLMKVTLSPSQNGPDSNLVLKMLKGNLKLLKNTIIVDLVLFEEASEWLTLCFKMVKFVLDSQSQLSFENYLTYKAMSLCKQIVYQTIIYGMNGLHQGYSRDIVSFGLKSQETFVNKFISDTPQNLCSSKNRMIVQCYSLEDMKEKRDRYFLNIKILSQIYLPVFNSLLKETITKIDSLQKASKFLFLISYVTGHQLLSATSFYYICKNQDINNFKKIVIGNCYLLVHELINSFEKGSTVDYQIQDVIFLYIQKILKIHFEDEIQIKSNLSSNEILVKTCSQSFSELNSQSKMLTAYFTWMFKIIMIKVEKGKDLVDLEPYFQIVIKYLRILVEDNQMEEKFQIVSIQCQLVKELMEFRNSCRQIMLSQNRKFFSEISILLHQEPEITDESSNSRNLLIQSEIRALLQTLELNPNDWIGTCYEITGFLCLVDQEKGYMKVLDSLGVEFIDRICQSCLKCPNVQKIQLFAYFTNSLVNPGARVQIQNFYLWFAYIKPIFLGWTQCLEIMYLSEFKEEEWSWISFDFLQDLLTNRNLNFYLVQRCFQIKQVFTSFLQATINFLNSCLDESLINLYQQKDIKLFKVLKILFRDFSEYFWLQQCNKRCSGFFNTISKLILFGTSEFKKINNRQTYSIKTIMAASKAVKTIIDQITKVCNQGKHGNRVFIVDSIESFLKTEKSIFLDFMKQINLAKYALSKISNNQRQKVKESDMELLRDLSQILCGILNEKQSQMLSSKN